MNRLLLLITLSFCACTENQQKVISGIWIEQIPQEINYSQGMNLKNDGTAESIGMNTLIYHKWEISGEKLILTGDTVSNGRIIPFLDSMNILKLNNDTLIVNRKNQNVLFVKKNREAKTKALNNPPSRKAYEEFAWKELSGAGLTLWAQSNENIRLIADTSLPGIVMVRKDDATPHRLIQIFDLPNNNINDVIKRLEKSDNWDKQQTCKFNEVKSGRDGVRRFIMIPDGEYAANIKTQMQSEPLPAPCNEWGVGNSGMRFFEIHESHPDKAIFIEIGQEAPLFDENSIVFSNSEKRECDQEISPISKDELYTLNGIVRIGHEVRSFQPEGCNDEFWIVDKTGQLNELYDKVTKGKKNGKPVYATLKVEYNGKWDDGFAAEYSGVYFVREILSIKP